MKDKYVNWFEQSARNILDNIMAQKVYMEEVEKIKKPTRLILGKNTYDLLREAIDIEDDMLYDMHITVDWEDAYLISVCYGSKASARDCYAKLEE